MSQEEVLRVLKKEKNKWLKAKEISLKVEDGKSSVNANLQRLHKQGEVFRKFGNASLREGFLWRIKDE